MTSQSCLLPQFSVLFLILIHVKRHRQVHQETVYLAQFLLCDYQIALIPIRSVMLRSCLVYECCEETCNTAWPISKCQAFISHAVYAHHEGSSDCWPDLTVGVRAACPHPNPAVWHF